MIKTIKKEEMMSIKAKNVKINFDKYNAKTIASIMDDEFIEDKELIALQESYKEMQSKYEHMLSTFNEMKSKNKDLLNEKLRENKKKIRKLEKVIL